MEFKYKEVQVGYSSQGQGAVVVFLHGFLENRRMWNSYIEHFSARFKVVSVDLLGHGDTGCVGYVHSMEENAHLVIGLLKSLGIQNAIMVGHSMGGYVALAIAELFPECVTGLVLVNSTAKADSEDRKQNRDRAIIAVKQNYSAFVRMSIGNLFSESNRLRLDRVIENVKSDALKTPLQGIVASLEGMKIRPDRQHVLKNPLIPCMIALGKKDEVLNFDETLQMANDLQLQKEIFEDGHMSPIENREELTEALDAFFRRIS